jgi:hypothetical protein
MKRLLQLGFILGLIGTLAGAYFAPWFEFPRFRSATTVVQNGGRLEQFEVRLPADRIGAGIAVPSGADSGSLEHFKLRDVEGNVIGLAARHSLPLVDGTAATSWLLTIPSRGTIAFAGSMPAGESLDGRIAASGLVAGANSEPEISIDLDSSASSVATTGEFAKINFELVETWLIAGLENDGAIRGTLRLSTVGTADL